eukprot:3202163-Amphidinium_carterae.2
MAILVSRRRSVEAGIGHVVGYSRCVLNMKPGDVLKWAGLNDDLGDANFDSSRFLAELGTSAAAHWRPLALISDDDLASVLQNMKGKPNDAALVFTPYPHHQNDYRPT